MTAKLKKKRVTKKIKNLALRYECAWDYCFKQTPAWKHKTIIENPYHRWADDLMHEAVELAESDSPEIVENLLKAYPQLDKQK